MKIKVKVYAPGFISHDAFDSTGCVELDEGNSISDLCQKLKVSFALRHIMLYAVNYDQTKLNTKLKDKDTVSFLFPFSGG
jgi:molybdopterin converting factor small subunit